MADVAVINSTSLTANGPSTLKSDAQSGPTHTISAKDRKMIQSIKELVGNGFSDSDIYLVLKESNMDLDESANKLLNQDPFHEVKRRNRKKEVTTNLEVPQNPAENISTATNARARTDRSVRRGNENYPRAPLIRNSVATREFRVVRDNRASLKENKDFKTPINGVSEKDNTETFKHSKQTKGYDVVTSDARSVKSKVTTPKHSGSSVLSSSNTVVGVYASSNDPVHVPSPESRSSTAVGAIKRVIGVVGGRRQTVESTVKDSSVSENPSPSSAVEKGNSQSESFRPFSMSKYDSHTQNATGAPNPSSNRPFSSHQNGKNHHGFGHQKGTHQNKEWKPKAPKKTEDVPLTNPPNTSEQNPKEPETSDTNPHEKATQKAQPDNKNVVIAHHIRVPEPDKLRLTFGSFGVELDHNMNFLSDFQTNANVVEIIDDSRPSSSQSAPDASTDNASSPKNNEQSTTTESSSPAKLESQLPNEPQNPPNMEPYSEIEINPTVPSFPVYDPQTGYEVSYFRPQMDRVLQTQTLPSHEMFNNVNANVPTMSASTIPMVQQQQTAIAAQMYPQVHLSHFANLMPYRQFIPPVYVPQMAIPGYSSSAAYPHPNGNGYVIMPGGNSHVKYGIQQFKPVPSGSPTGYASFTNPPGYGVSQVASGNGVVDDSSRMKFKDGSLYIPNPQGDVSSEMWMQNSREIPSPAYYGAAVHGAYGPAQSSHMQFSGLYPAPQAAPGVGTAAPPQVPQYQQPQMGHLNWTTNF